ncbi:flagellar biosynthetic protein FliO [Desulfolucanica intricata]|uniref:flagellar biosynthetic protein FliO n=1 Tax=Desulfolucanica intricata TaxID=1285191 RepID=UPI0008367AD1|nr:flagellar biosynthetic protein FliO [Desulfolucanica intricata]
MSSSDVYLTFIRLIFALPVVLVLAYLIIKYGLTRRGFSTGGRRRMQIIEQLPIGPKSIISIVQVGEQYFLLAQQEHNITLLKQFDRLPEPLIENSSTPGQWPGNFKSVLTDKISGRGGRSLKDEKRREK